MTGKPSVGHVLSLKWKALLFTSFVLAGVTASFAMLNYLDLRGQFDQWREHLHRQYAVQVQGLLDQSSHRLQQWSTAAASLPEIQRILKHGPEGADLRPVEPLWSILQLNLGVEYIRLVDHSGKPIDEHGTSTRLSPSLLLADSVAQVMTSETPATLIECAETCLQYAIAPVLGTNGSNGALVLGISLADVVLDFQKVSGTDLGLLVEQGADAKPITENLDRWLPAWNATVEALSNSNNNLRVLRALAVEGLALNALYKPSHLNLSGKELEVRILPLTGFGSREPAHLVVVADITDTMSTIRNATQRSIYLGISGLLVSEVLLLAILWTPMSRLKRAAELLPGLAQGKFDQVRRSISHARNTHLLRDEVDILNETAIALSHQLEELNTEVANRTQDLSMRMQEITHEKNFVTHVLDTAQAIILTQDENNRILMINRYGMLLTGYEKAELQGKSFFSLLTRGPRGRSMTEPLAQLATGMREHFEEECDLRCKDDRIANIVWHHSRLTNPQDGSPIILSVGMDITARKKAELHLAWLADHDPLTGLFNRRRFEHELEQSISQAARYGQSGALLFFDLDQFKYVNDTSGHRAGDRLLQSLGESLPALLRDVDVVGRLGGDEFAVILRRATSEEAVKVAKKILEHINLADFSLGDRVHKVSASMGIAMFPEHGTDVQELVARADLAMYQVKDGGRGGLHLLTNDDQSHRIMQERVLWKQRVETALKENKFVLFAQPIVNIRDNSIHHYEVLLRMRGDDGVMIGPAHFIEVAERSGLIHALDRMVMSSAIQFQANARNAGKTLTLTVNLSAHAFTDPDLLTHLKQLLAEYRVDPGQLIFEITETAALADFVAARRLMESFNEIGCYFALDDFGTGFSSFYYLRQLPFEFIKIDGSFIRNLAERPDDQVLVKAMVEIAIAFQKKTIAEQVEDAQTLDLLASYGVDYAQGYYTGRPDDITHILPS